MRGDPPRIAITIDDFEWDWKAPAPSPAERNARFLEILRARKLRATVFVAAQYVEGERVGSRMLRAWGDAGHAIGNHTYSHQDFAVRRTTSGSFERDILESERVLERFPGFQKIFRYPFLHEGVTTAKRDGLHEFLSRSGYRIGGVTVPTCDWALDDDLTAALRKNPRADSAPYVSALTEAAVRQATTYEALGRSLLGRAVAHTLLLHYTHLTLLALPSILTSLDRKGWIFVDAPAAFRDPIFTQRPRTLPCEGSVLCQIAESRGLDPDVPPEDGSLERGLLRGKMRHG